MIIDNWQLLTKNPKELNDTIVKMHHAAQAVAAFGNCLLPKAADDSQSNMNWHSGLKALVGQEVNLKRRVRLALSYDNFKLHLLNANDEPLASLALAGQTRTTALSFSRIQAREMGKRADDVNYPDHYKLSESAYHKGAPYMVTDISKHLELASHRHNAQHLLEAIVAEYEHATPVAVWPHHFDTGSVINVAFDDIGEATKTVGIGLAIPDSICDELYYYVSPWAKDTKLDFDTLPSLPEGAEWKNGDYKGAVLPLSAVTAKKSTEAQCELVTEFLKQSIDAAMVLVDAESVKV